MAEFNTLKGSVCDLRDPKKVFSPLLLADAESIATLADVIAFLEVFASEPSEPILSSRAAVDYVPLQYICEFLKSIDFAGIVYNSSVSSGVNAVLFNVGPKIEANAVSDFLIKQVKFETDPSN